MAVSASFTRRIQAYGHSDAAEKNPLLAQVLPTVQELNNPAHFTPNPLKEQVPTPAENAAGSGPGRLLHKYSGRALLLVTPRCFGNCRFCFRRHTLRGNAAEDGNFVEDFSPELTQIAENETLAEIILSGGDPLAVPDAVLETLLRGLLGVPHVMRVRIHTRAPIFEPDRVTETFTRRMAEIVRHAGSLSPRKTLLFTLHVNHPAELDAEDVRQALARLRETGATLLQQAVLLRGVNDDADTLATLYETLVGQGVLPYYLHQLDQVAGAAHFEVPEEAGRRLMAELRRRLPGYAVPRYVREVPEMPAKKSVE